MRVTPDGVRLSQVPNLLAELGDRGLSDADLAPS